MSEPLFLCACVPLSRSCFLRWLKSQPTVAANFTDWPEDFFNLPSMPGVHGSNQDALVEKIGASLIDGDGVSLCRYDEALGELQFGACFRYGDSADSRAEVRDLCAMLRGLAMFYARDVPAFIELFDSGSIHTELCIGLTKRHSDLRADQVVKFPTWFSSWLEYLSDPGRHADLGEVIAPQLWRAVKKIVSLGAARATTQQPFSYDTDFYTDGGQVLDSRYHTPLQGAHPLTFRRIVSNRREAFYVDRQNVWYVEFDSTVWLQARDPSMLVRGFCPYGADGSPVLLCGNTLWCEARLDYPDRKKTKAHCAQTRALVEAAGGIVRHEAVYDIMWLQPTQVDGASFAHVGECMFEDDQHVYWIDSRAGAMVLADEKPGTFRCVGELLCSEHQVWFGSKKIPTPLDCRTVRHLSGDIYADAVHVARLVLSGESPQLLVLDGADPAHFVAA
jgi:hypothetical protein